MIADMPRPRPPHLQREITRHGKIVWYVRVDRGQRIRIKSDYGTPEFEQAYKEAFRDPEPKGKPKSNSLAWLIDRYRESAAWSVLSNATRRQRENIFKHVIKTAGTESISRITRKAIIDGLDRRRDKASAGKHFLQSMRGLFKWAVESDLASVDPTLGLKAKRKRTEGFKQWPDEWCEAYEKQWPLGTRERVWYELIYCTGLRRGDVVRVGRQHVKNGRGMIRAQKNGETAYFIISDRCQRAIDAGPTGDLTYIVGKNGNALAKESFGNYFREACKKAGVPGSAHGIRKTRATIEAENGASSAKLDALFGWKTGSTTSAIYIRKANRAKLAFGTESGTSIPAPSDQIPAPEKTSNKSG